MNKIWPKLWLAFACTLLSLVGLEMAYRAKLYFTIGHIPLGMSATYVVTSHQIAVPHQGLGYELLPNRHTVGVRITEELPVLCYERFTNELGNYGPPKSGYATAELRLAVFGDSCTAVGGLDVWPTQLERHLEDRLGCRVSVLNFARDGYGVLQIFDLAALKVPQFSPDAVIISFISDDLTRARLPDRPAHRVDVQTSFVDPAVTTQWCERMLASPDPDDPLLVKLNEAFRASKAGARPINYFTLQASLLYNRLVWEDPFIHRPDKAANPRTAIRSYSEDARFASAVDALLRLGIPCYLVHLPEYADLSSGRYRLRPQEQQLLASLERAVGRTAIRLIPAGELGAPVESLFNYPHDLHPSERGLEFYAAAVDRALGDELGQWVRPEIEPATEQVDE